MGIEKILIVDDSATSRMIIKRCFEVAGYQDANFYEAEDGIKAVSFLMKESIDLIVSDLNMPKMDGQTFIKKLHHLDETKKIPVIVISAMVNEEIAQQLTAIGVKAVIKKPLSPEKIIDTLENQGA